MISLEDYQAMEETAYLLRSPANARRLLESIVELEAEMELSETSLNEGDLLQQHGTTTYIGRKPIRPYSSVSIP